MTVESRRVLDIEEAGPVQVIEAAEAPYSKESYGRNHNGISLMLPREL